MRKGSRNLSSLTPLFSRDRTHVSFAKTHVCRHLAVAFLARNGNHSLRCNIEELASERSGLCEPKNASHEAVSRFFARVTLVP